MNLAKTSLREQSEMLAKKQLTAKELLEEYLTIALKGSCISFCNDIAFDMALKSDARRRFCDELPQIDGLPFSLKDNIRTAGIPTTCNSRILKTNTPERNAPVVDKLINSGAVLAAKNCMREFSIGKLEDSAFELRNYMEWAGTDKNINIGAFSLGTDIGLCEFFCGLWTFKPSDFRISKGIFTGSPSLEQLTISARRADDLGFLYPFIFGSGVLDAGKQAELNLKDCKILVYDDMNMPGYVADFLCACGFSVFRSPCRFMDGAELIYDCILSTEFFSELLEIGKPADDDNDGDLFEEEYLKSRIEGFGFEVKKLIITGAHLLSSKNKKNTFKVIETGKNLAEAMYNNLEEYDFIAAPLIHGDKLSKASSVSGLPWVTVPFADVLPFKLVTVPEKERLLLDTALFLEKSI